MMLMIVMLGSQATALGQPPAWVPMTAGLQEARLRLVAVNAGDPHELYAGSERSLYRSLDGGRQWQPCFTAPLQTALHDVAIDPFDSRHLVLGTSEGLYASLDGGSRWTRVFECPGGCRVVRFDPLQQGHLWIGTGQGVWRSIDGGSRWQPSLSKNSVRDLALDPGSPDHLYALTDRGLWSSTDQPSVWGRLFPALSAEDLGSDSEEEPSESAPEEFSPDQLTSIVVDPQDPHTLYVGSTRGVLRSADSGRTWQRVTQLGLGTDEIRHLIMQAQASPAVYIATPKGVARHRPSTGRWETLYAGLPTHAIHRLAASPSTLYAATDQGLYSLDLTEESLAEDPGPSAKELLENFVHEPTIGQVQARAIMYAEVHPDKIRQWRRQAALQALLPTFSFGFDRDEDTYVTSSGSTTNPAFDRIIRAEDPSQSMDLSLNWDLGDLIWNDDQTSIDVRSKLMVQLRDDVISDVTRTFFERRRVQVELLTEPPNDPKIQLDNELRLQELTALLDGLTGGWFSEQLSPGLK